MGSTLSIHNDTNETVYVKVGDDEAALRITAIVGGVIAALSTFVIPGIGAVVGSLSGGSIIITNSALMTGLATAAATQSAVTTIVTSVRGQLVQDGYTELRPGQTHTSEKKTLSLWQQCHVIKVSSGSSSVKFKETYMRPIFTGATDGSNLQHDISFWVNRYPWQQSSTPVVLQSSGSPRRTQAQTRTVRFRPGSYVFTSYHGSHLRAWPEGQVDLTKNSDAWEKWSPVHLRGSSYAWKSQAHGSYLRANQDGTVDMAPHIREWETWTHVGAEEATCGVRTMEHI